MTTIVRTNNQNEDFKTLIKSLDKELAEHYGSEQLIYDKHNKVDNLPTVAVAYVDNVAAGCGCFKKFDESSVEMKRMFVDKNFRRQHVASQVLHELESWAKELSFSRAVLETGNKQLEAIKFYQKVGYTTIDNYGQYVNMINSICMKKDLLSNQ